MNKTEYVNINRYWCDKQQYSIQGDPLKSTPPKLSKYKIPL